MRTSSRTPVVSTAKRCWVAIIFIAFGACFTTVSAQNTSENEVLNAVKAEKAERQRISQERTNLNAILAKKRTDCYQQLAVTPCLNEARDLHNDKMRDLKRQEVSLNDTKRKRAAAEQLRSLDERNSPKAQLAQSQRRGRALEASAKREKSRQEREIKREAQQANTASTQAAPDTVAAKQVPKPQGKARKEPQKLKRPVDATQIESKRLQAAKREQSAQEHRAKMQAREAKRKKPAAKPLPVPVQ
jgi:colicin import membrane protein